VEIDIFSFVAISRIACRNPGERVRANLSFGGFPEDGLAMGEAYYGDY